LRCLDKDRKIVARSFLKTKPSFFFINLFFIDQTKQSFAAALGKLDFGSVQKILFLEERSDTDLQRAEYFVRKTNLKIYLT